MLRDKITGTEITEKAYFENMLEALKDNWLELLDFYGGENANKRQIIKEYAEMDSNYEFVGNKDDNTEYAKEYKKYYQTACNLFIDFYADFYLCVTNAFNCIVAGDEDNKWYCATTNGDGMLFGVDLYQKDKEKDYTYDFDKILNDLRKVFNKPDFIDITNWVQFTMTPSIIYNNRYFKIGRYVI